MHISLHLSSPISPLTLQASISQAQSSTTTTNHSLTRSCSGFVCFGIRAIHRRLHLLHRILLIVTSVVRSLLPPRRRLRLDPSSNLYFPNEPGKQVKSAIRLKNTSRSHVAFKVLVLFILAHLFFNVVSCDSLHWC